MVKQQTSSPKSSHQIRVYKKKFLKNHKIYIKSNTLFISAFKFKIVVTTAFSCHFYITYHGEITQQPLHCVFLFTISHLNCILKTMSSGNSLYSYSAIPSPFYMDWYDLNLFSLIKCILYQFHVALQFQIIRIQTFT